MMKTIGSMIFHRLDLIWGPHTVDRFANVNNRQLERFNSRFWDPETEAVDAFTVDWGDDTNWWCPPVGLVPRLIQHACKTKAVGTLIVPQHLFGRYCSQKEPPQFLSGEYSSFHRWTGP